MVKKRSTRKKTSRKKTVKRSTTKKTTRKKVVKKKVVKRKASTKTADGYVPFDTLVAKLKRSRQTVFDVDNVPQPRRRKKLHEYLSLSELAAKLKGKSFSKK